MDLRRNYYVFFLKINRCRFVSFETPAGDFEMIDIYRILNDLVMVNVVIDDVTKKTGLDTNNVLRSLF